MSKKNNKVLKYRKKPKAGMIIFMVVLGYAICFMFMYMSKSKIQTYTVEAGSLTANARFTGMAIRQETVVNSDFSGNISYYQRENSRIKKGDIVYTVDETGKVSEIMSQYNYTGENTLSNNSLSAIKSALNHFKTSYDGNNFGDIYDLKTDINYTVLEAVNQNIMNNIESIIESTGTKDLFQTSVSQDSGVVVYSVDGYEGKNINNISSSDFNKLSYERNNLKAEELVVAGEPAYKLINSESWYIVIPLTQKDIDSFDLANKKSITIRLKKDNITTKADFELVNIDGSYYGKLGLDKYMIRYASERFLDVELMTSTKSGLKIPVSSITDKEFYIIPIDYLTQGAEKNELGFIKEVYDEKGDRIGKFVSVDVFYKTDDYAYVDESQLSKGDILIKQNSYTEDRFVVAQTEILKGVYCVNTGYTNFCRIETIDQNDEYYIIKTNSYNGITCYDHILLDSQNFSEKQMIY